MPSGAHPDSGALEQVLRAIHHRGPDDSGTEVRGNVGLVNARLAIIDTSPAGHQPMVDPAGRWILTYNGEIFNHRALRRELSPVAFRGGSDTETLLHAVARWGPIEAATRSHGFFAFAALDSERRKLHLVRDRLGVKPLYLARHGDTVWFASELAALLRAGVPAHASRDALWDAIDVEPPYGRTTLLEGIERMLPGTGVEIDLDTLRITEREWWKPQHAVEPEPARELAALDRKQLSDRLEGALRTGVSNRLMADVPVGTMCSGGLDSSLITALAHDQDPSTVAFTISQPDEGRDNELRWAEMAASSVGVELETVTVSNSAWRAGLVGAVRHHEYPLIVSGSVPIGLMAEAARRRGIKVLLTGEAADELFGGYLTSHFPEFRDFLSRRAMGLRVAQLTRTHGPGWVIRGMVRRRLRRLANRADPPAARPDGVREAILADARRAYAHHPGPRGRLEASLLSDLSLREFPFLLHRQDISPMAHSIETRLPFLESEVLSLALNLPLEARVEPDSKGVLRDVASRHLPRPIVRRPKQWGMIVGPEQIEQAAQPAFLGHGMLRELLGSRVDRWQQYIEEGSPRRRLLLWTAEIWCRLFVCGHSVQSVEADLWVPERV